MTDDMLPTPCPSGEHALGYRKGRGVVQVCDCADPRDTPYDYDPPAECPYCGNRIYVRQESVKIGTHLAHKDCFMVVFPKGAGW